MVSSLKPGPVILKSLATVREIDFNVQALRSLLHRSGPVTSCPRLADRTGARRDEGPEYRDNLGFRSQNGVVEMTEPQTWTVIGVFAAMMLGGMTLMTTQFSRVIRAEVGGLRSEMLGELGGFRGELGGIRGDLNGFRGEVNGRLDVIEIRLSRVESKVDDLDTELTNLATRFWKSQ
jgi:hypothetical protein